MMSNMNTTERIKVFGEFITKCKDEHQFIGTGNPLAPILSIGQEPSVDVSEKNKTIDENIRNISNCFNNGDIVNLFMQGASKKSAPTWTFYQKLVDMIIYKSIREHDILDFGTFVFTTEMNNTVSKTTASANKKSIAERLKLFKESTFIQDFSVVILACGGYVNNNAPYYQINNMFGVEYDVNDGKHVVNDNNLFRFYTHHDKSGNKLVIHTRQLSQIPDQLVIEIAAQVREHLCKIDKYPVW